MIVSNGGVWASPRCEVLSRSGSFHGCRALTFHSQYKCPSHNLGHGSRLHLLCRVAHVAIPGGFKFPLAVAETNLGSFRVPSARVERNLSSSRVPLASAETRPGRARVPLVRAETEYGGSRVSSAMTETNPNSRKTEYGSSAGDADESANVSVWDSNAEGIRRSWRTNRTSSVDSGPTEERPGGSVSDAESSWQWWRSSPDDDAYEGDTDDDDDEDSIFSWLNFDNFDMLSAISMLRWMLPAVAIFLPWLLGGPMFLMMGFAFFPLAQKLLGLLVPGLWKAVLQGWNSSSSKSKQKQRKRSPVSSRGKSTLSSDINEGRNPGFWTRGKYSQSGITDESREESDFYYPDNEGWERTLIRNPDKQDRISKLGGWDDFDEDTLILRNISRGNKSTGLERRRKKKEVPLFFRLLIALFPFLRSWGGFI